MTLTYYRPSLQANNASVIYVAKERMKALGWTVPMSGDATTYNSSGDIITSGAAFATTKAWFLLVAPDSSWGALIQRGNAVTNGRVKLAWSGTFSGGSPSATQVAAQATATDEIVYLGGGTDAVPTYTDIIAGAGGNENLVVVADDAPPYGFAWVANRTTGVNGLDMLFALDPLITQSRDALDVAPSVAYWNGGSLSGGTSAQLANPLTGPAGWIGKGIAGGGIVRIPAMTDRDTATTAIPGGLNRSFYDNAAELFPMSYSRRGALTDPDGWKGLSSLFTWIGSAETTGTRLTTDEGDQWISLGEAALRWDGTAMVNDPSGGVTRIAHYRSLTVTGDSQLDCPDCPEPPASLPASGRTPTTVRNRHVRRVRK